MSKCPGLVQPQELYGSAKTENSLRDVGRSACDYCNEELFGSLVPNSADISIGSCVMASYYVMMFACLLC